MCNWTGCGRDFSVRSNLLRHVRVTHHGANAEAGIGEEDEDGEEEGGSEDVGAEDV